MTFQRKIEINPEKILSAGDLSKYPGGIRLTVAFYDPRRGVIIPLDGVSQWSYDLPTADLGPGESLNNAMERIANMVRGKGVGFTYARTKVIGAHNDGRTMHVLMQAMTTVSRRPLTVELADNIHKFLGYAGSNRVAAHLPPEIGWGNAHMQAA
jgi:hypothetical protein